jgi:hypothetical protein
VDFGTTIIVLSIAAAVVACLSYIGSGRIYDGVGKGSFSLDGPDVPPAPAAGSAAARAEQEAEVRQMLQAKSDRREARGEPPLDVDAELRSLLSTAPADPELREEVRQLVVARNERRARRGEEPLDVEAEVDRQLRDLGA